MRHAHIDNVLLCVCLQGKCYAFESEDYNSQSPASAIAPSAPREWACVEMCTRMAVARCCVAVCRRMVAAMSHCCCVVRKCQ